MTFWRLLFWVGTAFGGPPLDDVDDRFFAAPDAASRREVLSTALDEVQRTGMRDPLLVWRVGIIVGGVVGDPEPGGFLEFRRLGDASLVLAPAFGRPGPHVTRVTWNSETSRVEWEEVLREFNQVTNASSHLGHYHVRLTADFFRLLTPEIETKMYAALLHAHLEGTELERHLVRVLWASHREKPAAVQRILLRMRTESCRSNLGSAS